MEYGLKVDVYAMGIVLHELLTHERPWQTNNATASVQGPSVFEQVSVGKRPPVPPELQREAPAWCKLLGKCWAQRPQQRPTFPQIWAELELHSDSIRHSLGAGAVHDVHGGASLELETYVLLE